MGPPVFLKGRHPMQTLLRRNYSYYMLLPGLLIFTVLFIVPSMGTFYYAFTNWSGIGETQWVGLENFRSLLDNEDNSIAFRNTFLFAAVTTVCKILLGLALAIYVNQNLKTAVFLRSILFFPAILSGIAVALAFSAIYHPDKGLLNEALRMLHLEGLTQDWLTNSKLVMYSISFVEIWKWTGFTMVLFLAGLQTIPADMYESSTIDGANKWQQLRFITLPLLRSVTNANLMLSIIGGLKVFDVAYGLTGGGPGSASNVLNILIFKTFAQGRYGEATAANLVLFVIILVIVLSINWLSRNKEER